MGRKKRKPELYDEKTLNEFRRLINESPFKTIEEIAAEIGAEARLLRNIMRSLCRLGFDLNEKQIEYAREYFRNNRYATDEDFGKHINRSSESARYHREKAGIPSISHRICDDYSCPANAGDDSEIRGFRTHRSKKYLMEKIAAELTADVFISTDDVAKKYNVSKSHIVDRIAASLRETGVVDRVAERMRLTKEYFDEHPLASDAEFAAHIGKSENVATHYRRHAHVPAIKTRFASFDKISTLVPRIRAVADDNPDVCGDKLLALAARVLGIPERVVDTHVVRNINIDSNLRARFYNPMTQEEEDAAMTFIDECVEAGAGHPFKKLRSALNLTVFRCDQLRKLIALKNGYDTYNEYYKDRQGEAGLESARCLRPESYVCDVCGDGYPGISLPEAMFKRYLALWKKKKRRDPRGAVDDLMLVLEQKDDIR